MKKTNQKEKSLLYGLVLAGGKSSRMGKDKGLMHWHGKEQRYYLADLLGKYCNKTFISCRQDQKSEISPPYKTITDSYDSIGQYGALLSAMEKYPYQSWLVVACDMPFIDDEVLTHLIANRDPKMIATAYVGSVDGLPEPLTAIWEAKSKRRLLKLLQEGINCPRKALIKSDTKVKLIEPISPDATMNINTPEDAARAKSILKERQGNLKR